MPRLEGPLAALALVIVAAAMVATFAELLGNRDATVDGLVGAIFGYLLIAAAWSLLFRQLGDPAPRLVRPRRRATATPSSSTSA